MPTIYEQTKRFVQSGACIYKDNWCDGGRIGGNTKLDKEPCRYYDGKRCTNPKNPKNIKSDRNIARGDV